ARSGLCPRESLMRAYGLLLRLYPASFRHEYGAEMSAIFARRLQGAGVLSRIAIWCGTIADVVVNAALVHADIARQDLRYVSRTLRQSPGFAATAVTVVALGIGATTAAFSIVDFVLLRPLPFPEADRLAKIWEVHPGFPEMDLSPANYRDLKAAATSFETLGAYRGLAVNIAGSSEPQHIEGAVVTADVLAGLRVSPVVGRLFADDDDRPTAAASAILSYGLWQGEFGGRGAILGQTILLDGRRHTVVGVMPRTFSFPSRDAQVWVSMQFKPDEFRDRNDNYLKGIGRLRSDVSLAQARADVGIVAGRLRREFPRDNAHT